MAKVFSRVGRVRVGRSVFDLSYDKKFDCDMCQLIPVMCDEVVPGDKFKIGNEVVIRFQPLVAPVLHEINVYVHYFFVPYRLLWDDWENFITGGKDGNFSGTPPFFDVLFNKHTVGDYLGYPTGISTVKVSQFPHRSYDFIWNEYYRDENLQDEIDFKSSTYVGGGMKNRAWEKDYFTSALPWQQRGTAPALPIAGMTSAIWDFPTPVSPDPTPYPGADVTPIWFQPYTSEQLVTHGTTANLGEQWKKVLNKNTVDLSQATAFDISDLRLAFQIQKWMERNARAGVRYTEFLRSHFPAFPRDDRLDRPEYIGGSKSPVIVSEVLQTSSTDTISPQGNLAGHGLVASRNFCASYNVQEFGLIMGIMSVMPRSAYQQGIDRQWTRETRFDYYFPEFQGLSEQAILNKELVATGDPVHDNTIFGYQGRYDEMRVKKSMVCGNLRDTLDYWHLGRKFNVSSPPLLNGDFIEAKPAQMKRIFAVQSEPGLIVNFRNVIRAVRPMSIMAEPGLIDHH